MYLYAFPTAQTNIIILYYIILYYIILPNTGSRMCGGFYGKFLYSRTNNKKSPWPFHSKSQIWENNTICLFSLDLVIIVVLTFVGERTFTPNSWRETDKMVMDKVLSDERTHAYATTVKEFTDDSRFLGCKNCNWHKSEETFMAEVRDLIIFIDILYFT